MTPPNIIAALTALGAGRELMRAVEDLIEMSEDVRGRRERDRIRKKNQRSRPRMSADVRGKPTYDSKKESFLLVEESKKSLSLSRGGRLPVTWRPSSADIEFARGVIGEAWHLEADKFRDFWHGKPGAGGRKSDWPATWRNWIRKAAEAKKPRLAAVNGNFKSNTLDDLWDDRRSKAP